jgi:2'-5' RNA ligase
MEKLTQKWAIIAPLQSVQEGSEFSPSDFPLHMTLAGVFAIEFDGATLSEKLSALLAHQAPFEVTAGTEDFFGPNKDIAVMTLQRTPELMALYNTIHNELITLNAIFNTPQYEDEGYIPHSTKQKHAIVTNGESVLIDSVSIIDLFPNGDGHRRKIFKTIQFASSYKK